MAVSEIRRLDAGFKFTMDHGRTFPYRGKGLTIPTLTEVLETFPAMRITVEMKPTRDGLASALAQKLRQHRAEDRVIVASHDHELLQRFREASTSVATSFSKNEVRDFLARLRNGALDGYRPPGVAFQVPEYKGLRRVVSKNVIDAVHRFDVEVHVWTVNEPVHITRLLDWGVDGIMTDDPFVMAPALADVDFRFGINIGPPAYYGPYYGPWSWGYGGYGYGGYGGLGGPWGGSWGWGGGYMSSTAVPYDVTVNSLEGTAVKYTERNEPGG